jgi:hypothetical protein
LDDFVSVAVSFPYTCLLLLFHVLPLSSIASDVVVFSRQYVGRRYPAGGVANITEIPPTHFWLDCVWVVRLFILPMLCYRLWQETTERLSYGRVFVCSHSASYDVW